MVTVRTAQSDADLEAWREVRIALMPYERADSVAEMRAKSKADQLRVLAEDETGRVVGHGICGRSDVPGSAFVAPRVLPDARRRGAGTALLRVLAAHVATLDVPLVRAHLDEPESVPFAERFGFEEYDRQVEQVREVAPDEPAPKVPKGVRIVPVSDRPERWTAAYHTLAQQAFQDMALVTPIHTTLQVWEREWISDPRAMFLALAGDEIIGCAGLHLEEDRPDRAENALTAVLRDWRGRGVAAALKRTVLAWAAANGIREVYTWTQRGNDDMRRLNEHLGYTYRHESISMQAPLPLNL
ncbi:MAG: GNAT family N-acetyltransferase [Mycobacteriales bacterium]